MTWGSLLRHELDRAHRHGKDGDDRMHAGRGDDTVLGGNGEDLLNGGAGDDLLTGGRDADVFVFRGAYGTDTIRDFDAAEGDRLMIAARFEDTFDLHAYDAGRWDTGTEIRSTATDTAIRLQDLGIAEAEQALADALFV